MAAAQTCVSQYGDKVGLERTILAHEARALRERNVEPGETGHWRVRLALVADDEHPLLPWAEQQQRLLELWIVA